MYSRFVVMFCCQKVVVIELVMLVTVLTDVLVAFATLSFSLSLSLSHALTCPSLVFHKELLHLHNYVL